MNRSDLNKVTDLYIATFEGLFLSLLGKGFLNRYIKLPDEKNS